MILLKYTDYLVRNDNFLSDHEINLIQIHANKLPSIQGLVGGENPGYSVEKDRRDSIVRWIVPDKEVSWLLDKVKNMIINANDKFFHFDITECSDLQHTTYIANSGYYGPHVDTLASDNPQRKISFSIQLSDEFAYEGGDVLLYKNSIQYPFKASRKKGALILFTSLTLHEVTPVTSGTRQSIVGWVSGPPLK